MSDTLIRKKHEASPEVRRRMDNLLKQWNQLLVESENRGKGLGEAKDILQFNEEVEKVEAWIREKVTIRCHCHKLLYIISRET